MKKVFAFTILATLAFTLSLSNGVKLATDLPPDPLGVVIIK